MENRVFGYVRVSSSEQNVGRQIEALKPYDIPERDVYIDRLSGKNFNRPEYQKMKMNLRSGDTIIVKSIDRFGRSYREILNEWQTITQDLACHIIVCDLPLLNTANPSSEGLTGKFIADLVLQILCYAAENERQNIKTRQSEGISLALKSGVKFGRPKVEKPAEWDYVYSKWVAKEITAVEAMRKLNLKPNTFYRIVSDENDK